MRAIEIETDERALIEAAQQDPRRFADLYQANFDSVYAFVASRISDRTEVEDVVSEVFHQALENLGRFEWRGTPFIAWLLRIARNAMADRWRGAARSEPLSEDGLVDIGADDGAERRAILAELLDELPSDQRLVLVRRFIEQRSIREIAKELMRTEGAVKQLQFRALQNLRARMGEKQ